MFSKLRAFNLNYFRTSRPFRRYAHMRRVGREHFIPVCPTELVQALITSSSLTPAEESAFRQLAQQLGNQFHRETQQQLRELRTTYARLNPDADTVRLEPVCEQQRAEAVGQLFQQFEALVRRANFRQLDDDQLAAARSTASAMGVQVDVDLDKFERLAIFARGRATVRHHRRHWRNAFRSEEIEVPIYQRLVFVFRSRHQDSHQHGDVGAAYIRLFKNVPEDDVDMALPFGQVRISWLDQGKIWLPTISGLSVAAVKIVKGALLLAFAAGIYGMLAVGSLLAGAIGAGMKSFHGYKRTKYQYELSLTRNLYYQNLDNNMGVLFRLAHEAETQELREALLAYHALWLRGPSGATAEEIQADVESFLRRQDLDVEFEIDDALAKLTRLALCHHESPRYHATDLPTCE